MRWKYLCLMFVAVLMCSAAFAGVVSADDPATIAPDITNVKVTPSEVMVGEVGDKATVTLAAGLYAGPHNLPSEYTELEYIESTGTQYLILNQGASVGMRVEFDFEQTSITNSQAYFGEYLSGGVYRLGGCNGGYQKFWFYQNVGYKQVDGLDKNVRHTYVVDDIIRTLSISDIGSVDLPSGAQTYVNDWYLFWSRDVGDGRGKFVGKAYSFKIYRYDEISLDLVPAKRYSDDVVGMYDLVSGQFFTNQGTGSFTAGPTYPNIADYGTVTWTWHVKKGSGGWTDLPSYQTTGAGATYSKTYEADISELGDYSFYVTAKNTAGTASTEANPVTFSVVQPVVPEVQRIEVDPDAVQAGVAEVEVTAYIGDGDDEGHVLPDGYTELQYLYLPEGAYIATNVETSSIVHSDLAVFKVVTHYKATADILSASSGSNRYLSGINGAYFGIAKGKYESYGVSSVTPSTTDFDEIVLTVRDNKVYGNPNRILTINGIVAVKYDGANPEVDNWYLGSIRFTGDYDMYGYWGETEIYSGDTLLRKFIPCVDPDNNVGIYDLVEGKFYTNAGTGTLIAGPAKYGTVTYDWYVGSSDEPHGWTKVGSTKNGQDTIRFSTTKIPTTGNAVFAVNATNIVGSYDTRDEWASTPEKYKPISVYTTISLDPNGGSGDVQTVHATLGSSDFINPLTGDPESIENPTYSPHTFYGWYAINATGGVQIIDEDGYLVANLTGYTDSDGKWIDDRDGTLTLYARWIPEGEYYDLSIPATVVLSEMGEIENQVTLEYGHIGSMQLINVTMQSSNAIEGQYQLEYAGDPINYTITNTTAGGSTPLVPDSSRNVTVISGQGLGPSEELTVVTRDLAFAVTGSPLYAGDYSDTLTFYVTIEDVT